METCKQNGGGQAKLQVIGVQSFLGELCSCRIQPFCLLQYLMNIHTLLLFPLVALTLSQTAGALGPCTVFDYYEFWA